MKIVSFIDKSHAEVVNKILRHCGLWKGAVPRLPLTGPIGSGRNWLRPVPPRVEDIFHLTMSILFANITPELKDIPAN